MDLNQIKPNTLAIVPAATFTRRALAKGYGGTFVYVLGVGNFVQRQDKESIHGYKVVQQKPSEHKSDKVLIAEPVSRDAIEDPDYKLWASVPSPGVLWRPKVVPVAVLFDFSEYVDLNVARVIERFKAVAA